MGTPSRWMYVLPSLFTVGTLGAGFLAMSQCVGEGGSVVTAALAIWVGMFCDGLDGRVARWTHTETKFGVELDSLADVCTFGAAPALLTYRWALQPLGTPGLVASALFLVAGALRLARFNVAAHAGQAGPKAHFTGMPTPSAAGGMLSLVLAQNAAFPGALPEGLRWPVLAVVVATAGLMVSTLPFRTFKDIRRTTGWLVFLATVAVASAAVGVLASPGYILLGWFVAYVVAALVETAVGPLTWPARGE